MSFRSGSIIIVFKTFKRTYQVGGCSSIFTVTGFCPPDFRVAFFGLPRPPAFPAARAISFRRRLLNFFARANPPNRESSVCSIKVWYTKI
jgi:hypothetical protein